ncbi:hypothetical protein HF086_013646 [Spodoptera exigua]|uniref:I/LWEQ domain-containing protein n=1 Tax=Spodoptera exigua TaxID=7107 RepID=A0A922MAE1_SPOEX|nr:hypothetical protein HF086_013646 [Spodoptera exigua]
MLGASFTSTKRGSVCCYRMSLIGSYDESDSFVDYQTRMVGAAKEIARLATDMTAKSATDASRLVQLGNEMCQKIRVAVVELGEGVSELIKAGGHCRLSANPQNQRAVADSAKIVNEKVCTLHSEKESDTFSDHRENILKTAKTLVEDTKTLVGGAAGTQEQLASAAQSAVSTIVQLCEVVKLGAMSLGSRNPEPQVLLLHAARDVAAALRDLAAATTAASGKHVAHPDMHRLKHAAKRLSDATRRWSLPLKATTIPRQNRRSAILRNDYNSADSETDIFQSDQEDELVKLLDYSSQDDDVSPTIFHDNCEEIITYIENEMTIPPVRSLKNDDLNERYNLAAKNSLLDMDWRVLKYGENILLGEVKKLVDMVHDLGDKEENKRKRDKIQRLKANNDLDTEMKRLSAVIENLDTEIQINVKTEVNIETVTNNKPKLDNGKLTSPVFKVKKVRPVSLDVQTPSPEATEAAKVLLSPEEKQKDESMEIVVKPDVKTRDVTDVSTMTKKVRMEFWKMFKDDTEWWKALAKRNLEKMEETRRELERFSGHELVLGEFQTQLDRFENEKHTLQNFIDEVDKSKAVNQDLEYNKKYEDMVLKLIDFAKKDFIYKGFDPLIEQLKALANVKIDRKKKVDIQEILNIYSQIDTSKYTYEELCLLERYYKEIIRKYKKDFRDKENIIPENRQVYTTNSLHRNVNRTIIHNTDTMKSTRSNPEKHRNSIEIMDLTRTYPMQYYANNWWTIYEDVLRSREQQFGSIDNWWQVYERILNKTETTEDLERFQSLMRSQSKSRPSSRMEEQLRMLDEIRNDRFKETEAVTRLDDESGAAHAAETEDLRTRTLEAGRAAAQAYRALLQGVLAACGGDAAARHHLPDLSRHVAHATADIIATAELLKGSDWVDPDDPTVIAENELLGAAASIDAAAKKLENQTYYTSMPGKVARRPTSSSDDGQWSEGLISAARLVAAAAHSLVEAANALVQGAGSEERLISSARQVASSTAQLLVACKVCTLPGGGRQRPRPGRRLRGEAHLQRQAGRVLHRAATGRMQGMYTPWWRPPTPSSRAQAPRRGSSPAPGRSRPPPRSYWSHARYVHSLVEAANALVQGAGSEERLISSARQVASSTAQLLVACKVCTLPGGGRQRPRPGRRLRGEAHLQRQAGRVLHRAATGRMQGMYTPLVEAANALVQGAGSEESLISSARQVASSTAQLLVACKVCTLPGGGRQRPRPGRRLRGEAHLQRQAGRVLHRAATGRMQGMYTPWWRPPTPSSRAQAPRRGSSPAPGRSRPPPRSYWSHARYVHSLVEAANALVQGAGSEERLISSARQVASSTAQLLVACKVCTLPGGGRQRPRPGRRLRGEAHLQRQAGRVLHRAATGRMQGMYTPWWRPPTPSSRAQAPRRGSSPAPGRSRPPPRSYWSHARYVHSLVEAANALVQGAGSEERLISSARQVASSTAQLLVACKVCTLPGGGRQRPRPGRRLRGEAHLQRQAGRVLHRAATGRMQGMYTPGGGRQRPRPGRRLRGEAHLQRQAGRVLHRAATGRMQGMYTPWWRPPTPSSRAQAPRRGSSPAPGRSRPPPRSYWSHARYVHSLVEAANALVQGAGSEERLISSARQVASSTAQLLVACKVKADPSSESTRRLQAAGAEVIRSTDNLVRAARDAIHTEDERSLVLNRRMVGGIAQEIDARSEVLRIEKELEEARGRLTAIRQAKYKLRAGETSGEDTDTDLQLGFKTPNSSFANTTYSPNSTYSPHTTQTLNTTNISSHITQLNHSIHGTPAKSPVSPGYYSTPKSPTVPARPDQYTQSFNQEKQYTVQSPSFSSFRPAEEPKQNYEGFTTRLSSKDRTMNEHYETRLYDTPRPLHETTTERQETLYDYKEHKYGYEPPKTPLSPKFNARELKFDDKEPIYSTLKKPFDGVGQTFSEHQKSSEAIPGGVKHSEFKVHSESYQSYPKTEYSKTEFREEVKSPFASTPKFDRSTELVKAATPDYDRIASPYKESTSYGGPNYMEETTTEVKEIPNGTQKITTTKIYSSSPVNLTTTNTKYEPIRLDGIDELSKSFDNDSKYSTLDSRFNTLESKMSSDTSRSFMRPSEFQSSDYQSTTNVTKVKKPSELVKEIDSLDKKFSKQTITSETIERKSVMTSSHKSESSSTITKKFGNF